MTQGASDGGDTLSVSLGGTGRPENARIRPDIAALYQAHRKLMYNTAYRVLGLNRQSDVDDAVQDAWAKVSKHYQRPSENDPDNWAGWLVTVTRHCALDRLREAQRHDDHSDLASLVGQDSPSGDEEHRSLRPRKSAERDIVSDEAIERDRVQRLRTLIAQLPQDEAIIVHLKIFDDIPTNAALGRMLDTPRTGQSVGQVLRRVLGGFADELQGDGR